MHAPAQFSRIEKISAAITATVLRGESERVIESCERVLDADNGDVDAYLGMAELAMLRRQYDVAIALLERVLASGLLDVGLVWARLANALWRVQDYEGSHWALQKAHQLVPHHKLVKQNLGLLAYFTRKPELALFHLERALEEDPDDRWIQNDHAHAVLMSGDLARGLELFECRWSILKKSPAWECGLPLWSGASVPTNTLLLHAEQGLGDTIQFIRFVPEIKNKGAFERVIFAGPLTLKKLIQNQCGVDDYVDFENPSEILRAARRSHVHAPLLSAVAKLKLSYDALPPPAPYLVADRSSPRQLRPGGARLAVGLVWAASVGHERSRQRSVKVTDLLALGTVPGVRLWSLQMAPHGRECPDSGADLMIGDATSAVMDFADTAGVVQELDVIVTVDTSMVHLAGALGKRCFMLNPLAQCWRWCRGARPWYGDSVELFDQSNDLTWTHAIDAIRIKISEMVENGRV